MRREEKRRNEKRINGREEIKVLKDERGQKDIRREGVGIQRVESREDEKKTCDLKSSKSGWKNKNYFSTKREE